MKERISRIIDENAKLNDAISNIATLGLDYSKMTEAQQYELGAYVNLMNASTQLLINPIKDLSPKFSMTDLDGFMAWKDRKQIRVFTKIIKILLFRWPIFCIRLS